MALLQKPGIHTYEDYCSWPEDERWELIDGVAYAKEGGSQEIAPPSSRRHQEVVGELFFQIANFLRGKPCKVYVAPFDVRLSPGQRRDTVVQPDISVISNLSKLDDQGCEGAPDWIIEVSSPASSRLDTVRKYLLYEACGVREYWIVNPMAETVMVFRLGEDGRYGRLQPYENEGTIPVGIFDGALEIDLAAVFQA